MRSPETAQVNDPSTDTDSKKIEQEFEQYQEKLKQQKAEWEKEHPDQVFILRSNIWGSSKVGSTRKINFFENGQNSSTRIIFLNVTSQGKN